MMNHPIEQAIVPHLRKNQDLVREWLREKETGKELPLYSSTDIRNAGYKVAVVDTNLFPAGFNNLCQLAIRDAEIIFRHILPKRVPSTKKILLVSEEHTRNKGYLDSISVLGKIIRGAGFEVTVAMPPELKPESLDYDLIILNNDLTEGIPPVLQVTPIPIYPPLQAGWHSRLKSHHFYHANRLLAELGD